MSDAAGGMGEVAVDGTVVSPTGRLELGDPVVLEAWGAPPPSSAQPDGSSGQSTGNGTSGSSSAGGSGRNGGRNGGGNSGGNTGKGKR